MEVENEMQIFLTLTKCNTRQRREKGKQLLVMYYLISYIHPLHNNVQLIYEDISINVRRYGI